MNESIQIELEIENEDLKKQIEELKNIIKDLGAEDVLKEKMQ